MDGAASLPAQVVGPCALLASWRLGNGNVLRIYCNLSAHELVLNTDASTDQRLIFAVGGHAEAAFHEGRLARSAEHTSELQSLMRTSYAAFCLKKNTKIQTIHIQLRSTQF